MREKINKRPEFYMIFARKIYFCPNLGGGRGKCPADSPSPTLMTVWDKIVDVR